MELFPQVLKRALGTTLSVNIRSPLTDCDWRRIYAIAQNQAVGGVIFDIIDDLCEEGARPPLDVLYEWISFCEQIKQQNIVLNKRCADISNLFFEAGFKACILKGQGNAMLYPNPFSRIPGDIDIWVDGKKNDIFDFAKSINPEVQDGKMHFEFPIYDDVKIEVHYKPSYSRVHKYEKRLQRWFDDNALEQFCHQVKLEGSIICVPTLYFNVVHQMSHMMRHFFSEGIGLRHLVDYYYVLNMLGKKGAIHDYHAIFNKLGMLNFAKGIMWVEREFLGIKEDYLIAPQSKVIGQLILKDVMSGGNFGHSRKTNVMRQNSTLMRGILDSCRLFQICVVQPSEAMSMLTNKIGKLDSFIDT